MSSSIISQRESTFQILKRKEIKLLQNKQERNQEDSSKSLTFTGKEASFFLTALRLREIHRNTDILITRDCASWCCTTGLSCSTLLCLQLQDSIKNDGWTEYPARVLLSQIRSINSYSKLCLCRASQLGEGLAQAFQQGKSGKNLKLNLLGSRFKFCCQGKVALYKCSVE